MITFTLVIALIATASALPTHHRLAPHSLFPNKANRTLLSTEQLLAAFDADGYQVVKSHTLPNGHRGFLVRSKTASIWASDGMYKVSNQCGRATSHRPLSPLEPFRFL